MDATVRQSPVLAQCFEGYHCLFDIAAGFQNNFRRSLGVGTSGIVSDGKTLFQMLSEILRQLRHFGLV